MFEFASFLSDIQQERDCSFDWDYYILAMKKKVENRYENKQNELSQTNTSITFDPESTKSIQHCSTLSCSQLTMEEKSDQSSNSDLETSFRRDLISSQIEQRNYNPNLKKSKILLVQIDKNSSKKSSNNSKVVCTEAEQLAEIERKTQELVMRENQQRKQLKKMKQLYFQKLEEIKRHELEREGYIRQFSEERSEMAEAKLRILQEKSQIEAELREMQKNYSDTKEEIIVIKHQRQCLVNRVQLLEANFDFEAKEKSIKNEYLEDMDLKIQIVQQEIIRLKDGGEVDYCRLAQLLDAKCQFMQKRQSINEEEGKKREKSRISLFNQILMSRNAVIEAKNMEIQQLKRSENTYDKSQQKQLMNTTSSTFFGVKREQQQQSKKQQDAEEEEQWDEIKIKTLFTIESSVLKGHEESYEAVKRVAMGMLQIFSGQQFEMQDISDLIDLTLDRLSQDLVSKAKTQSRKTSLLLKSMRTE